MLSRYFDHAATSPLDPRVRDEMLPWLGAQVGNAHSIHQFGQSARAAVELARERVAHSIGAEYPSQIVFVSGASEAATWLIASNDLPLFCSPFEHSCVREAAAGMGGYAIPNDGYSLDFGQLPEEFMALVMAVNNETGAILPKLQKGGICDATQAIGHVPFSVGELDAAFFSGHKFGAPQGIGAVYLANPSDWNPLIVGGGQESGLRGGTLNVASIVGLGLACELASNELDSRIQNNLKSKNAFLEGLGAGTPKIIEPVCDRSSHILSLTFPEILAESLVIEMDLAGFAVSAGSACSAHSTEISPVLTALGYTEAEARGTLRISFGNCNNEESSNQAGKTLATIADKLRISLIDAEISRT